MQYICGEDIMLIILLLMLIVTMIFYKIFSIIYHILYKIKINNLLESISTKEDLLYMHFKDFQHMTVEVLKRKGYKVDFTNKCGIDGSGLKLNDLQYAEVWKHGLNQVVEVELARNLAKCMQVNSIFRGMLITLGDFKHTTRTYCHKNVIECINGDQLLKMCKEVQRGKVVLEPAK
jgi:restriction system protein